MKRMFDFVCESGERIERFTEYENKQISCNCGKVASRALSAPNFNLEGWSGDFPSSWLKFDQKHRDKLKAERKANA